VSPPDLSLEEKAWNEGYRFVAGIDEAGRGAWAGPVAAAAVILPVDDPDLERRMAGVQDSKVLSARRREALLKVIRTEAISVGVAMVGPETIIECGILTATRRAMDEAVQALDPKPDYLLVDYLQLPQVELPQENITKGDAKSLSVAAASIVAKVTRDRLMVKASEAYQNYGFDRHKGYGTRAHRNALENYGVTSFHRYSWAPFQAVPHEMPDDDSVNSQDDG
jgi:ribonuclease HII